VSTVAKAVVQLFTEDISFMSSSAFLGSFQNPAVRVISSFSLISFSLASTSKIPP